MKRLAGAVLAALIVLGCGTLSSRGTMPPPGVDGEIDPSAVPDFVSVAGDTDIVGYVPKAVILEPTGDEAIPVVGEDLQTVVGHLVPGKGFVPLGVDPATVPVRPAEQGPSAAPADGPGRAIYVRNRAPGRIWLAVKRPDEPGAAGFDGGMGVSCGLELGGPITVWVREPADLAVSHLPVGSRVTWVDRAPDGTVTTGEGVPEWWTGGPSC